jgi:YidC/Oxa1 family membrane protein insertase
MDFITLLGANAISEGIGKFIYDILYKWISGWSSNWTIVGAFSVTVIIFTLFLKAVVFPLDVWQKILTRKNAKIMEEMKPELEKANKQCGANKELQMQKQRAIYKKHKYSAFSSCLPMVLTLAIFFIVFGGFNSAVARHNLIMYQTMEDVYDTSYQQVFDEYIESGVLQEKINEQYNITELEVVSGDKSKEDIKTEAVAAAEKAVLEAHAPESFLLTKNIFVSDTWKSVIPDANSFTGGGRGGGNIDVDAGKYQTVMRPLVEKYQGQWNGYLLLPIFAFVVNILSMKLNKMPDQPVMPGQSEEQIKAQKSQAKIMQYMMPIMMLVFAVFYSSAFTLYMVINSLITTIFNFVFNIVTKRKDALEKDRLMSITVK